jgi:hypothetical protein
MNGADYGRLYDAATAALIGPATRERREAGDAALAKGYDEGVFLIDADGDPVAEGSHLARDARTVYVLASWDGSDDLTPVLP